MIRLIRRLVVGAFSMYLTSSFWMFLLHSL